MPEFRTPQAAVLLLYCVAHAPYRPDEWPGKAAVDLVAQVVDIDLDYIRRGLVIVAPDVLGDLVLAEYAPGIAHQIREQVEFLRGQLDRLIGAAGFVARQIEHELADHQLIFRTVASAATERSHPSQQLLQRERLGQIVVGTGV